jgi:zinc/manganese transport system substrate-binding protein
MNRTHRTATITGLLAIVTLAVSGCAASTPGANGADGTDGTVRLVASTDVYGDIAKQIGGSHVSVTSVIDDPSKDPHEYEADARTQLKLSRAQIVIENGGGYDDFMGTLLKAADNTDARVLNVADISGYDQEPADGEFNEHLWYDFPTIEKLSSSLVSTLSKADPAHAEAFEAAAKTFTDKLGDLEQREADLATRLQGTGVAITEPVPLYLLEAAGLVNKTPEAFSEAIEEDNDVAPGVLKETTDLFAQHKVALLVYNEQTGGPQTELVLKAAKAAGVPRVGVTETLPADHDYLGWMSDNLNAIGTALDQ